MRSCEACSVDIEGSWTRCPLCGTVVAGLPTAEPSPAVALRFSRRRLLSVVFVISLALIAASLAVQLLLGRDAKGIGALRVVWLGLITMWLVVLMAVRKRRTLPKGTVYLVALVDLLCVYWDFLIGWYGWSITYAVPIVNGCAVIGLLIAVEAMRTEVEDHILYSGATVLLGLVPVILLVFGWVTTPVPSIICGASSIVSLAVIRTGRVTDLGHELSKRLNM